MMEAVRSNLLLRAVALAVASAGALFWLYTFYGIAQVPIGEWFRNAMDRGDAARANLRGIYTAGPGLLVERSFSIGRAHPRLRWPHCVRVLVERVARRIL